MTIDYTKLTGNKSGGGGKAPTMTPDNLRSKDTVEVILALCEGPIKGLKDGMKSFYVGDTPLQNANGSMNFGTFQLKLHPGSGLGETITPVLGGRGVSNNTGVSVVLASGVPVIRQSSTKGLDFLEVRLLFNRLMKQDPEKGTFNHSVNFRIEYKRSDSPTWIKAFGKDLSISGKTTSQYVKEFLIQVPKSMTHDWDIRVTKLSPDSTETLFTDMAWESFQETISGPYSFPNTAAVHLVAQASDQFSSIPAWSGIYDGLMIRVPSNYNPTTRQYVGLWDGTFNIAWTDNPAWIVYDFVMSNRYGLANIFPDIHLDKYSVYEAGQWCDEMVPDGKGGLHPRYTCNLSIAEPRNGMELARYLAGLFNATFFDNLNGSAVLRVDKDDDACQIFTHSNIIDGRFEYSYTDLTSRYNDITVTFINPDLDWAEDRRRVYSQTYIDKNGRVPLDFIAVGCTNEREALRRAHYKMLTSNRETCIVNFKTNRLGQFLNPFNVILIADRDQGYGISGRIKSINNGGYEVELRTPVYLEAGVEYILQLTQNNGGIYRGPITVPVKGYNSVLFLSSPLEAETIADKAVFTLEHPTYVGLPRPFRVLKVDEEDGDSDVYTVQAINIDRNKWYDSDHLVDSGAIEYSVLPSPLDPPGPTSVGFFETYVKASKEFQLLVEPVFPRGQYKYYTNDYSFEVWSRLKGTTDAFVKQTLEFGDTIINHPPGLYEFKILGKSYLGMTTDLASAPVYEFNVANPKDPPADIEWAKINSREVFWGYSSPPADFAGFIVRYHNEENRTTWDDAIQPHQGLLSATSFYTNLIPPSARTIMIKAVDDFGIVSVNSAVIHRALGDVTIFNIVEKTSYAPLWPGVIDGGSVESGELRATDLGDLMYSGVPTALIYDGGDFYEATYDEMTYTTTVVVNAEGELIADIGFLGSGYELSMREVGTVDWLPIPDRMVVTPGTYDIKLHLFGGKQRAIVSKFDLIIDSPDIEDYLEDVLVVSPAPFRLTPTKIFNTIKVVSVIIQDTGSSTAVGYRVIDKDPVLGPEIVLLDKDNNPTGGLIDVIIRGY